ncbi:MAG: PKD domain-containing protein, partial [Ginsengibacter sp.]
MGLIILGSILTLFTACSKSETAPPAPPAPSNLTVTAVPKVDSSGNVDFTATATNAITYDFDFGNGIFQAVPTGIVTYRYPTAGTYTVNVLAKNAAGKSVSKSVVVTVVVAQTLVWSDEFNTDGMPDATKWGYDLGNGSNGWGNSELEYYTNRPENAIVQGGVLKINAIRENYSGFNFTSARLLSKGKFEFKYGKVEVSAKMP